ncbi:MAG TPA: GYD domain-containing protein [Blastocatellia bacterium]|nr:GYD domain-containing protein [Blastocatellia bacterium]
MPIYVTLLRNTAQGAKEIKDFGKAVEEAAGWIASDGGKVLGAYALQGNYDFVWITEYPDHAGIGKSLLSAAARGIVVTETLEALPIDKFVALLNSPEMKKRFSKIKS